MAEPNYLINAVFNWVKNHPMEFALVAAVLVVAVLWVAC